jgi:hypothetical protein
VRTLLGLPHHPSILGGVLSHVAFDKLRRSSLRKEA